MTKMEKLLAVMGAMESQIPSVNNPWRIPKLPSVSKYTPHSGSKERARNLRKQPLAASKSKV